MVSRLCEEKTLASAIAGSDRVLLRSLPRSRVTEGFRTLDPRSHNPVLYQLSYSHHTSLIVVAALRERAREDSNL